MGSFADQEPVPTPAALSSLGPAIHRADYAMAKNSVACGIAVTVATETYGWYIQLLLTRQKLALSLSVYPDRSVIVCVSERH